MKKLVLILAACLLLCGCSKTKPQPTDEPAPPTEATTLQTVPTVPETTVPETTVPETEPLPQTETGYALADRIPVVLATLSRGTVVEVVGEYDKDTYIVQTEIGYGLVEKCLLRMEGDAAFRTWTGYAKRNATVYDNYLLQGEPVKTITLNKSVVVVESLGYSLIVRVDGKEFYTAPGSISKTKTSTGGGGSTGADGGDISLSAPSILRMSATTQQSVTGRATVLADDVLMAQGYLKRGDEVQIVTESGFAPAWDGFYTIYFEELYVYVPMNAVRTEDTEEFKQWDAFAKANTSFYDNYLLLGKPVKTLKSNTKMQVLDEVGDCYLVKVNDTIGYIAKTQASKTKVSTSSGGSSGGGEWTPPAL